MATADWFAATAVAEPAPAPARRRRRGTERPAPLATPRRRHVQKRVHRRVRAHIVWMVAFAVLLAGVVAINVAVLRANVAVHRLDEQRAQLQAENQALASRLSSASSAPQVERFAQQHGLVQAPAADTSYLDLLGH